MKALEKYLNKIEPNFAHGGKFEKWHPLYETMATFAFTPKQTTLKGAHIRDAVDLKRTMMMVIFALVPCLLFGIYNTGHFADFAHNGHASFSSEYWANPMTKFLKGCSIVMPLVIVSYGVGLGVEFLIGMMRGHSLHEGFLVSGLLIPLTMPADVPLWMVAVATAFAVFIGKEVFGGTGMNIVNIALTARAFIFFGYPTQISGDKVWMAGAEADGVSGATALGDLASFNGYSSPIFSNGVASFEAKYSVSDSFFGMIPGSIGETSTLACLIGAVILIATGVGSFRIIASFFAGGAVMAGLLNMIGGSAYNDIPFYYHMIIGSFAFGAVFMATDPVSAAQTPAGKIIYGFLGGFISVIIRVFNPAYPEGVMLSILLMNVLAPIIDHFVIGANISRRMKRLKLA
jgi:Na+-transporting NADH:ubiquinone oxidoreductase subunit B